MTSDNERQSLFIVDVCGHIGLFSFLCDFQSTYMYISMHITFLKIAISNRLIGRNEWNRLRNMYFVRKKRVIGQCDWNSNYCLIHMTLSCLFCFCSIFEWMITKSLLNTFAVIDSGISFNVYCNAFCFWTNYESFID